MKKYFIFAALATVGLFASCSSDDNIGNETGNLQIIDDNDGQMLPIQVGIGASANAEVTRGSGTVGSVAGSGQNNYWEGQKVNVYMFHKGSLNLAKGYDPDLDQDGQVIYNNVALTTPSNTNEGIARELTNDGRIRHRYYPSTGNYDFWGYFLDDAGALPQNDNREITPSTQELSKDYVSTDAVTGEVLVPFVIDGTQDLMVAKAELTGELDNNNIPTSGQLKTIYDGVANFKTVEGKQLVQDQNDVDAEHALWSDFDRYYSAYAARRDIQPSMTFNHLLTRLQFEFKGGTATSCGWKQDNGGNWTINTNTDGHVFEGVFVESVTIESETTGQVIAAYTAAQPSEAGRIVWDNTVTADMSLMSAEKDVKATWSAEKANAFNAKLDGAIHVGDVKTPAGTHDATSAAAYNAQLTGHVAAGDAAPADFEAKTGNAAADPASLTAEEAIAYNATLQGAVSAGDPIPAVYYTTADLADINAANAALQDAVANDGTYEYNPDPANEGKLLPLHSDWYKNTPGAQSLNTWGKALNYGDPLYNEIYKLTATAVTSNREVTNDYLPVGSALLLKPSDKFTIKVKLGQYLKKLSDNGTGQGDVYYVNFDTITLPNVVGPAQDTDNDGNNDTTDFLAGNSYKVRITVYGAEEILVTTVLNQWANGGNVDVNSEDYME